MEKEIAAQLAVIGDLSADPVLGILQIMELAGKADINKVIGFYREIREGKLKVALIRSALDLVPAEQERISKYLEEHIAAQLVIIFKTDPDLREGLEIKVGDDLVQFS